MPPITTILKEELTKRGYPILGKTNPQYPKYSVIYINHQNEKLLIDLSLAGTETDTLQTININDPHSIENLFHTIGPPNPTILISIT